MADTRAIAAPPRAARATARHTRASVISSASVAPPAAIASSSRKRRSSTSVVAASDCDQIEAASPSATLGATASLHKRYRSAAATDVPSKQCSVECRAIAVTTSSLATCRCSTPQSAVPTPQPAQPPAHSSPTAPVAPPAVSRVASASPKVFVELTAERAFEPACGLRTPTPRHSIIASLIEDNRQLQKERVASSASPSPLLAAIPPPIHSMPPPTACAVLPNATNLIVGNSECGAPVCSPALGYHVPQLNATHAHATASGAAAAVPLPTAGNYYQQMAHAFMASSAVFFAPPSVSTTAWGVVAPQ